VQIIPKTVNGTEANVPCAKTLERSNSVRRSQSDDSARVHAAGRSIVLWLIPESCPSGQRQRQTVNKSTLFVENDSKVESKPIESPHSVPGPRTQQNSLFVDA